MKHDQKDAAKMKAAGFYKFAVWAPIERGDELKAVAAKMREEHKPQGKGE